MNMRADQKQQILEYLTVPHSAQELGKEFGTSYHNARRWLKMLIEANLVQELPFRRQDIERSTSYIVYQRTAASESDSVLIQLNEQMLELGGVARGLAQTPQNPWQLVGSLLAYRYLRAYHGARREESLEHEAKEGYITTVECKQDLRGLTQQMREILKACEQMIFADIWEEGNVTEKFGPGLPVGLAEQLAQPYIEWYNERRHGK